jgi:hypothetical protein
MVYGGFGVSTNLKPWPKYKINEKIMIEENKKVVVFKTAVPPYVPNHKLGRSGVDFDPMVQFEIDEEFEYIVPSGKPLTVCWNLYGDEIGISAIYWEDNKEKSHYTGDELWEWDIDLAEDIAGYIEDEFLWSEDFWLSKQGENF